MGNDKTANTLAQIDQSILDAMEGYLRVCGCGGMPKEKTEQVRAAVAEAAKLGYFSLGLAPLIAEGIQDTRRLDVLDARRELVVENQSYSSPTGEHVGNAWNLSGPHADVRAAIDAIIPEATPCSS